MHVNSKNYMINTKMRMSHSGSPLRRGEELVVTLIGLHRRGVASNLSVKIPTKFLDVPSTHSNINSE